MLTRLRDAWFMFRQNWFFATAVVILLLLYLTSIFAGFLSPYSFDTENRKKPYHSPTPVYFWDDGGITWPYILEYTPELNENYVRVYKPVEGKHHQLQFFVRGDSYSFLGLFTTNYHLFGVEGDAPIYLLGADSRGRDVLSRLLYGGRISLSIGLIGVLISISIGLIVGGISGYFGGWVDVAIQRLIEAMMMVPGFYLLLALRAAFPSDWSSVKVYFFIIVILSFIGWAGVARVIRGMALSLREKEFVMAARSSGASDWGIILKHIIPNTSSYFVVAATVQIPGYILGESALSLLGLGIQDPYASWGNMLQNAMNISEIQFHPWILIPGFLIFLAVMSFNLVGDALRDILDPEHEIQQTL